MTHARMALARASQDDLLSISAASALTGLASWTQGDLTGAYEAYSTAAEHLRGAGNIADVLACTITLADIATTQGRLRDAAQAVHNALKAAELSDTPRRTSRHRGHARGTERPGS